MIATTVDESGTRRAVTKLVEGERLVSCTCCTAVAGCCMYPASQLGVGYTASDLPNTLEITNGGTTVTATKSGSSYPFTFGINSLSLQVIGGSWAFDPAPDEWSNWVNSCLITDDAGINVKDTFADTYNYTVVWNGNTLQSGTISRDSLCLWTNKDIPPGKHKGIVYNENTYKFELYDPDELVGDKTSAHNTPEGQYVQGNLGGLYDGAITTIFA